MRFTLDLTPAELAELISRLAYSTISQEIETMSGTLSDQLAQAQADAEALMTDISAKVDQIAAAAGSGQVSQDNVDRANRIVKLAQAVSDKLDAAASGTVTPAA